MPDIFLSTIKLHLTKELFNLDNNECHCCGSDLADRWYSVEPHHIKSRSVGGSDKWYNRIPLCLKCHGVTEGAKYEDFAREGIVQATLNKTLATLRRERIFNILKWGGYKPTKMSTVEQEEVAEKLADSYLEAKASPGAQVWR